MSEPTAETEVVSTAAPKMYAIFKSRISSIQYVFSDGSVATFARRQPHESAGHYLTDNKEKIEELTKVSKGHPHIYIDPEEFEVEARLADPAIAREQAIRDDERARVLAELGDLNQSRGALVNPNLVPQKDLGATSMKAALAGIGNSKTMAPNSAESNAPTGK